MQVTCYDHKPQADGLSDKEATKHRDNGFEILKNGHKGDQLVLIPAVPTRYAALYLR